MRSWIVAVALFAIAAAALLAQPVRASQASQASQDNPLPGTSRSRPSSGDAEASGTTDRGRQSDLETLRSEIQRLESLVRVATERERTLEDRLSSMELDLELQLRRVEEASLARLEADQGVEAAEAEVMDLQAARAAARRKLSDHLLGLYRFRRQGYLRFLLDADANANVVTTVRLLRYLARRDATTITEARRLESRLQVELEQLEARRGEAFRWQEEEAARGRALKLARQRQVTLLDRARRERVRLAGQADDLIDKEKKLSNLIDFLYGRRGADLSGTSIVDFRGVLDWPVNGKVTQGFGPRRDPRYATRVPHNGIEIELSTPASQVRTVYPGKVLFAAPFDGFGQAVVVLHSGRVLTLYARLDRVSVAADDVLQLGDVVGSATGSIYFEIRAENRPQDPADWLR